MNIVEAKTGTPTGKNVVFADVIPLPPIPKIEFVIFNILIELDNHWICI
jgi:hypothetical protein